MTRPALSASIVARAAVGALAALGLCARRADAQGQATAPAGSVTIPPAAQQIAAAVLPAPKEMRDSATVLGYAPDGRLVTLREGRGGMIGVTGGQVDSVRFAEARAGKLALPDRPAALYSLTGPAGSFDPATGAVTGAR